MSVTLRKHFSSFIKNKLYTRLIGFYTILLLTVISIACYFSYQQRKEEILSQINMTYVQLAQEYRNIVNNHWQIYMPIFESEDDTYDIWDTFFAPEQNGVLSPFEKIDLEKTLKQMLIRNNDVRWIVLYNENREDNYILYSNSFGLELLPEDFPYQDALHTDSRKMRIYGANLLSEESPEKYTFAICSSVPDKIGEGKILTGYSTAPMYAICDNSFPKLTTLNYVLTSNDQIIFDNSNHYDTQYTHSINQVFNGISKDSNGHMYYTYSQLCGSNTSFLSYHVSYWEFFRFCHSNTLPLLLIFVLFIGASVFSYMLILHRIEKELYVIKNALQEIGKNNLDYQIPTTFSQNDFIEIASSINKMTCRLKENINRAYYFELKQREAKLSELQSKFNPHFLYNTLEMIRSRSQLSGDNITPQLISQLSSIFRGFISPKNFIPLKEELSFSQRYLALFEARYEDMIDIRYDFDKDILQYGIIRNVFQPLIENYFVHGFDTNSDQNYILFTGKSLNETTMLLTVEDNGSGMSDKEIDSLNAQLHEPILIDKESYGLKNLHQRLQLFYGNNCGLTIYPNPNGGKGICVQITALKLTCEEYEKNKPAISPDSEL